MRKIKTFRSGILLLATGVCVPILSRGAITACPTATSGSALSSFAAGNTPAHGCANVDLGFNTFTAGGTIYNSGGTGTTLTTGLVDLYSPTVSGPSGNTQGPITSTFDVPGTPTWSLISGSGVTSGASNVGYEATVMNGTSGVTPPTTGHWAIDALTVGATYATPPNTDTITIHELICAGATSTTVGSGGCIAAHQATITLTITGTTTTPTIVYSDTLGAGTAFTFNTSTGLLSLNGGYTEVAVNNTIDLARALGTTVTLDTLSDSFDQEAIGPEPSTLLLLGSALVGLGALRFRRRK